MPIAESLAVIVGLITQFKSERNASSQSDFDEFKTWLDESRHQEVIEMLSLNSKATIYIKGILNQDRSWLKERLERIDNALTAYASSIDGFSELAEAIRPNAILSSQALEILKQFEVSGASKALKSISLSGTSYRLLGGHGSLNITNEQFAEDDFSTLIELCLLRKDYNSKGDHLYIYTRAASELVKSTQ